MLSDEAFSKMDESRSRSVLQFLSRTLGLQLVVAMPTSKSGAVKPEFDKEFTFSKVLARRDGQELFISDVQEKTLHRDALARLWADHAAQAREAARKEWTRRQRKPTLPRRVRATKARRSEPCCPHCHLRSPLQSTRSSDTWPAPFSPRPSAAAVTAPCACRWTARPRPNCMLRLTPTSCS